MVDFNDIEKTINESKNYIATGIGGYSVDGVEYAGYGEYTFTWEKTLSKTPERALDGNMGNLDTFSSFVVPRMKVDYSLMTITDYRRLMKQYLNKNTETNKFENKNHFTVTCYDPIYDETITADMYMATPAEPKFYTRTEEDGTVELLGVRDYTVEFIGTNYKEN